ncbi:MAG: hypothetical protein QM570_00440 [Planctomycetota bacterium]|nr:hypothetical protein [Planctomycetota bacterium]
MIVSDLIRDMIQAATSVLTPLERWSAARRLSESPSPYTSQHGFILAAVVTLVVLIGLLWWISHRRRTQSKTLTRELFAESAVRRGLSGRERQILLAIVMRGGLRRSHDIFTTVDAFDRGAAKLLAECRSTRTLEENERLKTEVAYLREKLGFRALRGLGGSGVSRRPSSRDIPVGRGVEMTRRRRHASVPVRAEVVRNDDLELAVQLDEPVEARAGDLWCVRYAFGVYVWEFDATAVTCDRTRLVLNHTDDVRFVNRRRFPRVAVHLPALVACFPFARRQRAADNDLQEADGDTMVLDGPTFVSGTVTELAGPGLRIEVPSRVRPGERVLVVFRPTGVEGAKPDREPAIDDTYVLEDIGLVRHCRAASGGMSIAVELSGLSEAEIDELVRITNAIASKVNVEVDAAGVSGPVPPVSVAAEASVVQEI